VVDNNTDARVAWTGPVGVLINRNSASASEIFAAAIQDYGRGIVIGERSFGKGTVQSTVDLDALVKHDAPEFGELQMTVAQFFRIDGDTTQLRGVRPDIDFSTAVDNGAWGEAGFDNALPSFKVKPAHFVPQTAVRAVAPELASLSSARIALNPDFQDWKQQALRAAQQRKDNVISLNEAERRKERQRQLASRSAPTALASGEHRLAQAGQGGKGGVQGPLADDGLEPDERWDGTGLGAAIATAKPKDVVVDEAVHVVSDEVKLLETALADGARPPCRPRAPQCHPPPETRRRWEFSGGPQMMFRQPSLGARPAGMAIRSPATSFHLKHWRYPADIGVTGVRAIL
jgi:carboxyl-terminal processing protease